MKHIRKRLSVILVIALLAQMLPASVISVRAATSSGSCGDNVLWSVDGTTLSITGTGAMTDYSYTNKVPWASYASTIKTITIASNVTTIGNYAFSSFTALTKVTIPNTVTDIGSYAFNKCVSLTSVTIPNSVTNIDSCAFYGNTLLENISMGTGLKTIGSSAFYGAKSLTSLTLGSNVVSVGLGAFYGASALSNIVFNSKLEVIDRSAFMHCSSLSTIALPTSLTTLGCEAFSYTRLASVTIPKNVTDIHGNPFAGCPRMTNITVDADNSKFAMNNDILYEYANATPYAVVCFLPTSAKSSVLVASGTKIIYENAFSFAANFVELTLPDTLTTIEKDAFSQCDGLQALVIPDSVTSVAENAFLYLTGLKSASLGKGVPSAVNIFFGCTSLANVTVSADNTKIVAQDNVIYDIKKTTLQYYAPARAGKEYHIADTTTTIAVNAIYGTSYLKDLYVPASLTEIEYQAICDNKVLNSVFFAGNAPDYYSTSLVPITTSLDNMLIYITEDATGWDGLYWNKWGFNFVYWDPDNTTVYSGTSGDVSWKVEEGIGRITLSADNAALSDFASVEDVPWYRSKDILQTIEMTGVTSLGSNAFANHVKMIRVEADGSLAAIGNSTFKDCATLKFFDDVDVLTSIGTKAFSGATALQEDICFRAITSLGEEAFKNCENISVLYFGNKLTTILPNTFAGCISLKKVILPESLTQIQTSAFSGATSLRTINIPASVTTIGSEAFAGTGALEKVYFYGTVPSSWQEDSFSDSGENLTLYYRETIEECMDSWSALDGTWNTIPVVGVSRFYSEREDTYSFSNTATSFGYGSNYRIPVERYREVLDIVMAHYYYAVNRKWAGNCFGMSSTTLSFYEEDNDISNYDGAAQMLYEVAAPQSADSELTKLIEAYQIAQFHPNVAGKDGDVRTYLGDYRSIVHLVEEFERSGGFRVDSQATPIVLGIYSLFGAHAVVPTSVMQDDNGDYILTVYDCNYPTELQTMKIYKDFSGINYLWYTAASCITYKTIAEIFHSPSSQAVEDSSLYLSIDKQEGTVETTTSSGEVQKNGDIEGGYEQKNFANEEEEETFSGIRSFVMPQGKYRVYDASGQETSEDSEEEKTMFYLASDKNFAEIETSDEDATLAVSGSAVSTEPLTLSLESDEETITSEFSIMNKDGDVSQVEISDSTATLEIGEVVEIEVSRMEDATVKINGEEVALEADGSVSVDFDGEVSTAPEVTPTPTPTATPTVAPTATPTTTPTLNPITTPTPTPTATSAAGTATPGIPLVIPNGVKPFIPAITMPPVSAARQMQNATNLDRKTKLTWKGNTLKVSWPALTDADGYTVAITDMKKKTTEKFNNIQPGSKTSFTIAKHNGKKLNKKTVYRIVVSAYCWNNGKKVQVANGSKFYVAGNSHKAYTNVKKLKPKKKKVTLQLKKKKKAKLSVQIVKQKKKKKLLPKSYGATLTYLSSNKKIATVTKKGVVKAKKKGSCYIYVRALNGVSCKVKITVKK